MTTEAGYELSKSEIDTFIAANDDRTFLSTWVEWWHARRCFIFRAFAQKDAPRVNKAEVIHAGWAHRERPNLSMLDVCQADTRDSLLVEIELKEYLSGAAPGGTGPSYADLRKNKHALEMKKAKRLAREMFSGEECGQLVDPQSSHCPRANQRKRQNKSRQQKHQSNLSTPGAAQSSQTNNAVSSIQRGLPNVANSSCFTATNTTQHGAFGNPSFPSSGGYATSSPHIANSHHTLQTQNTRYSTVIQTSFMDKRDYPTLSLFSRATASAISPYSIPHGGAIYQTVPTFPAANGMFQQQASPVNPNFAWHSGLSAHNYEVVLLRPSVRNCYGCGNPFGDKYRSSPNNVIVKHVGRRVTGRNNLTGTKTRTHIIT